MEWGWLSTKERAEKHCHNTMTTLIEKLTNILHLEAEKYEDQAVYGGLARYASTWVQEAGAEFGAGADGWIEDIAGRLRVYSDLPDPHTRRKALSVLMETLQRGPSAAQDEPARHRQVEQPATQAAAPAPPPPPRPHTGLESPITALQGVGPRQSKRLAKLGAETIRDLLYLFPRRYDDYSQLKPINRLEYGEEVTIIAQVWDAGGRRTRTGKHLFKATLSDGTGLIEATWFNQPYLADKIVVASRSSSAARSTSTWGAPPSPLPNGSSWRRNCSTQLAWCRSIPLRKGSAPSGCAT